MDVGSALAKPLAPAPGAHQSRRHYRQRVYSLAYVNVNQGNGGIIRDLSETGLAVQTVAALREGEEVSLRFDLHGPRVRMEATGRVAWATATGQAGIEFISVPVRLKRLLKEWIFIQILTTAHNTAWGSIFGEFEQLDSRSSSAVAVETVESLTESLQVPTGALPEDSRWAVSSPGLLAWTIDGLIILSGVLLFWVIAITITQVSPGWQTAAIIWLATGIIFAGVYRAVFVLAAGVTPGNYFAGTDKLRAFHGEAEEPPRFR